MRTLIFAAVAALLLVPTVRAEEDPLAKFKEEELLKIDFCFNKFCEAVAKKDAKLAAAFIEEIPRGMGKLDLNKKADADKLLKHLEKFAGCTAVASQKMAIGGLGEVTYNDKAGKEGKQRMQKIAAVWKVSL